MSVKMLSMNLAGSKKLSEILQARDLAPHTLHLAGGLHHPQLYITRTEQGRPAGHSTRGNQNENATKPDGNLEKESEINLEDLHFIFSAQDTAILPFYACFLHTSVKKWSTVSLNHTPLGINSPQCGRYQTQPDVRLYHMMQDCTKIPVVFRHQDIYL